MDDHAKVLSEVAPTLAQLKKLPMKQKCRLLLARLSKIGQHDSALNKHNLMLPGDPYGLAYGYPETEKRAVREHLLGAPWTGLVNEGFLVDLSGQGFHKVSDEGKEYLDQKAPPTAHSPAPDKVSKSASGGAPRALLSYSWDGPEHQQWVMEFAKRLRGESGVEIIFDRWHMNPGDDKLHFMEQAVAESDFVIVVCTPQYAERANKREGGVGYESMVITAELAEHILTKKFIPVMRKGSWTASLPIYLKSRMGVNLSDDPYREDEYEKLLRVLHGETIKPPPVGSKPNFSKNLVSKVRPNNNSPSEANASDEQAIGFVAAEAKDGTARFRAPDQPLGLSWNRMPFVQSPEHEIFLAKGPAMWFRLMPRDVTSHEWSHDELLKCGMGPGLTLQPLLWSSLQYLRAEDGIGVYATIDNLKRETETGSVTFAFDTGEIWCVDTTVLNITGTKHLYFLDIARVFVQKVRGYGEFLQCLGLQPPFDWIAGLEGVKGRRLEFPPPSNHVNTSSGETCLTDVVLANGTYDTNQPIAMTLRPFFNQLFKKCSMKIPEHIDEAIRTNRTF